jgi:hypothetical protein
MDMKVGGSLRDYITKEELECYFAKSGSNKLYIRNLIATDWGFASFDVDEDGYLFVWSCYGDGKLWKEFFISLAKQLNLKGIRFSTRRNPEAWKRLYKDCELVLDEYVLKYELKE